MWERSYLDTSHVQHALRTMYWHACRLYAIKRSPMLAQSVYTRELEGSVNICNGTLYDYSFRPYFLVPNSQSLEDYWTKKILFTYLHARQHVPLSFPKTFTQRYDVRYVHDDTGHTTVLFTPKQVLLQGDTSTESTQITEHVQLSVQPKLQWSPSEQVYKYFVDEYSGLLNLLLRIFLDQMSDDTRCGEQREYTIRTPDNFSTMSTTPVTIGMKVPHIVYKKMQVPFNDYVSKCLYLDLCVIKHVPRYVFNLYSKDLKGPYTKLVTELLLLRLLHAMMSGRIVVPSNILDHAEASYLKPYSDLHDKDCVVYNAHLRYRTYDERSMVTENYSVLVQNEADKLFDDFNSLLQYYARTQPVRDTFITELTNSIIHLRLKCSIDINKKSV